MEISKLIKLLDDNIKYDSIEEIINGDCCIVFKVKINDEIYYFKFLRKDMYKNILLEIDVVDYLNNNGVLVPRYYSQNSKKIFSDDEYVFYATKEVDGEKSSRLVDYNLMKDIIENVAIMHKELRRYPINNIYYLERETDFRRLQRFIYDNNDFLNKYELKDFINRCLKYDDLSDDYMLIHADLNFRNIFVKDNKFSSFIDFTDMRIGCKEDDLGKLWQNILYLDNINIDDLKEFRIIYENILKDNININNLIISCVYRIIYRYYYMIKNREEISDDYLDKTKKVLEKVLMREV